MARVEGQQTVLILEKSSSQLSVTTLPARLLRWISHGRLRSDLPRKKMVLPANVDMLVVVGMPVNLDYIG
jgi:hypothetical protein